MTEENIFEWITVHEMPLKEIGGLWSGRSEDDALFLGSVDAVMLATDEMGRMRDHDLKVMVGDGGKVSLRLEVFNPVMYG